MDWTTPTLRGTHVTLEPLLPSHVAGLREAVGDGQLWNCWYTNVPKPDDMEAYVASALAAHEQGQAMPWAVRDAHGDVVGTTRYYQIDRRVPYLLVGYTWYARRVQRTGLNTEAKRLLLGHAFETLGCTALGFQTSWFNHASRTAIARLGAKQDGVIRAHQRHADGTLRDTVAFSIIESEWPTVRRHLDARLETHAHG